MVGIEDRKYNFYYMDETVLERYDLLDSVKFNELHQRLKTRYESTKQ
jgi:hypothetical protein